MPSKSLCGQKGVTRTFMSIKKALCAGTILSPFNVNFTTKLFIDYSNLGLGMALTQEDPNNPEIKRLIWCSSHAHKSVKDSLLPPDLRRVPWPYVGQFSNVVSGWPGHQNFMYVQTINRSPVSLILKITRICPTSWLCM